MTALTDTVGVDPDAPVSTAGNAAGPTVPAPLSAAECAERAAACLKEAAKDCAIEHRELLISCADQWRQLGQAMASFPPMNRPREHRDDQRR